MNKREVRKRRTWLMAAAMAVTLTSCIGMKYLSLEQMIPPEVVVPLDTTRIGVLNNFSVHNVYAVNSDFVVYSCNADTLVQSVAQSMADAELFSEVVVLDSCLYPEADSVIHILTRDEVRHLCDTMNVNLLFTCDYGCLTFYPLKDFRRDRHFYMACHVYAPTREKPLRGFMVEGEINRGIFRNKEALDGCMERVYPAIGELAADAFQPGWEPRERNFYDGYQFNLREATVCVKEGNWDEAVSHWRRLGRHKRSRYKLAALYNEALYYEMNDSIEQALGCLEAAEAYATADAEKDSLRVNQWLNDYGDLGGFKFSDNQLIQQYRQQLKQRQTEVQQLNILHP